MSAKTTVFVITAAVAELLNIVASDAKAQQRVNFEGRFALHSSVSGLPFPDKRVADMPLFNKQLGDTTSVTPLSLGVHAIASGEINGKVPVNAEIELGIGAKQFNHGRASVVLGRGERTKFSIGPSYTARGFNLGNRLDYYATGDEDARKSVKLQLQVDTDPERLLTPDVLFLATERVKAGLEVKFSESARFTLEAMIGKTKLPKDALFSDRFGTVNNEPWRSAVRAKAEFSLTR